MDGFLKEVAESILSENKDLRQLEIIVPNRRTGLFLKKALSESVSKTTWMPKVTAIQEIFLTNSDFSNAEDILLIYRLYSVFIKHTGSNETFDDFYYWGEIILNDFDDIDKYLVDASKLFSTIRDLKEIDKNFDGYDEAELEIIKRFWSNINQAELSIHKQKFLDLWDKMYAIYTEFHEQLIKEKIAYQGLIYKTVANKISECSFEKTEYAVVGFNALNKCEKILLTFLKNNRNTSFYWDADKYYVDDEFQEAGRFLRVNIAKYGACKNTGIVDLIKPAQKEIEVIMAPSQISQVKMIAGILDEWSKEPDFNPEKTAIVLGDENLLIPLMYSIPPYVEPYNVSMGFPVRNSAAFGFVYHLISLRRRSSFTGDKASFYFKDALAILNHSFVKSMFKDDAKKLDKKINDEKIIYVKSEIITQNDFFLKIFREDIKDVLPISEWLNSVCQEMLLLISTKDDLATEVELLRKIAGRITVLNDCLISDKVDLSKTEIFYKLLLNAIRSLSAAFEGEPLQGMQVLGFLETRCLDFDRVIMLSINEGVFPKKTAAQSLIPYNLRKFYELPSIEFQDSIFAYYFYRLLQRSKEIKILYSAQAGDTASEASRFISQIKYEIGHEIKFRNDGYKINISPLKSIYAAKTPEVLQKIRQHLSNGISPKAINTYLNCGLQYYFNYIEKIQEPEKLEEEEDGAFFGKLFHEIVSELYKPYIGKVISDNDFINICQKSNIESAVINSISEVFNLKSKIEINRYREKIIVDIVLKYVDSLLDYDRKRCPLSIVSLETKHEYIFKASKSANSHLPEIKISGIIDRVDIMDGTYRVVDYKTGKAELVAKSIESITEANRDTKYNTIVQLLLYSLMIQRDGNIVCPAVLNVNELNPDYDYHIILNKNPVVNITDDLKNEFLDRLESIFVELTDENSIFEQTQNQATCKYCPYKTICSKNF